MGGGGGVWGGAFVQNYYQGSADIFTGGSSRPPFSSLFPFDDHLQLNVKALLEEAPALAVVLRGEQVQMDVSAAF